MATHAMTASQMTADPIATHAITACHITAGQMTA